MLSFFSSEKSSYFDLWLQLDEFFEREKVKCSLHPGDYKDLCNICDIVKEQCINYIHKDDI